MIRRIYISENSSYRKLLQGNISLEEMNFRKHVFRSKYHTGRIFNEQEYTFQEKLMLENITRKHI